MKAVAIYNPNSERSRSVDEFNRNLEVRTGKKLDLLSTETPEGSAMAELYGIMDYPAIVVITDDGKIVIATGDYVIEENAMKNIHVLHPPQPTNCEKNWVYVPASHLTHDNAKGRMNFIYGWNPLTIGSVNEKDTLEIHTTYETPAIFGRFRGSSALVEYQKKLYAVIHLVKYSTPRSYYHSVVQFNLDTMKPEAYSAPFSFCEPKIEYCLGFQIQNDEGHFFFSRNDTDPSYIHVPMNKLRMISLA
jgi:hypothetical protein